MDGGQGREKQVKTTVAGKLGWTVWGKMDKDACSQIRASLNGVKGEVFYSTSANK